MINVNSLSIDPAQEIDHNNCRAQIRSNMAVAEDNSFEFALQETAKVFSQSGKSINLKPEQVAAIKSLFNGKDVLAVLPTGFGKSAIFQFFVHVKEYMSKDLACILFICPLRSLMEDQMAEARSISLTANSEQKSALQQTV